MLFTATNRFPGSTPLVEVGHGAPVRSVRFADLEDPTELYRVFIFDLLSFYLLTNSIIDLHHKIKPDELSLYLIVIGGGLSFQNPYLRGTIPTWARTSLLASVGGAEQLMLFFAWGGEKLFKKEGSGRRGYQANGRLESARCWGWTGLLGCSSNPGVVCREHSLGRGLSIAC